MIAPLAVKVAPPDPDPILLEMAEVTKAVVARLVELSPAVGVCKLTVLATVRLRPTLRSPSTVKDMILSPR